MGETLTGAEALIKSLEHEGVEVVFGVPGGAILPAYDPILDSRVRHILARHVEDQAMLARRGQRARISHAGSAGQQQAGGGHRRCDERTG